MQLCILVEEPGSARCNTRIDRARCWRPIPERWHSKAICLLVQLTTNTERKQSGLDISKTGYGYVSKSMDSTDVLPCE